MVCHLQDENAQLREELERLRKQQKTSGSNTSWSTVTSRGQGTEPSRKEAVESGGSPPPKARECEKGERWTPNGTKVPDGTPPRDDVDERPRAPPPAPILPPFPSHMGQGNHHGLDDYEPARDDRKQRRYNHEWVPVRAGGERTVSPGEARNIWLTREVQVLQNQVNQLRGQNRFSQDEYWSRPVMATAPDLDRTSTLSACAGIPTEINDRDRCRSQFGAAPGDGDLINRACSPNDDDHQRHRAVVMHGDHHLRHRADDLHGEHHLRHRADDLHGEHHLRHRADDLHGEHHLRHRADDLHGEHHLRHRADDLHGERRLRHRADDTHGEQRLRHRVTDRHGDHRLQEGNSQDRDGGLPLQRRAVPGRIDEDSPPRHVERPYDPAEDPYLPDAEGKRFGTEYPSHDCRSAWWTPPENGGETVEVVGRPNATPGDQGTPPLLPPVGPATTYAPIPHSWESSSGNSRAELPVLPGNATPLQYGDWLHLCGPTMRDISGNANQWWEATTQQALKYYNEWKSATPLNRIQIEPQLPMELRQPNFGRTEQRGVHLLLKAISEDLQQTIIADRQLSSTGILFKLYIRYQPGGPGEKSLILKELTSLPKTTNIQELAQALRGWRRHFGRAREVDAALPDGVLLLKALECACQQIAKLDSQAAFRLAQSRSQLSVDERPTTQSIWAYSQCLLAETETLVLMSSSPSPGTDQNQIKVRQVDAGDDHSKPSTPANPKSTPDPDGSTGKGKGGTSSQSETPCKWFRSETGCRSGKNCRWSHSWDGVPDRGSRCWTCGSTQHRKNECPVRGSTGKNKSGDVANATGGGHGGGGGKSSSSSGKSPGQTSSTTASTSKPTPDKPKVQEMQTETSEENHNKGNTEVKGGGGDAGATKPDSTAELLQEATQLLKSLRGPTTPKVQTIRLAQLDSAEQGWMLVDSGATHALRPAKDLQEWEESTPTSVSLAEGNTMKFRLKKGTKVLLSDPEEQESTWILPVGGLAEIGFGVQWAENQCSIVDKDGNNVQVQLHNGCPMIQECVGREIIDRLEQRQRHLVQKMMVIKRLISTNEVDTKEWNAEVALTFKLRCLFPMLPDEVLLRLVPDMEQLHDEHISNKIPWNRRIRKRIDEAENVIVHLYAGKDHGYWTKHLNDNKTFVLCVDILGDLKANVLDDATYTYLMRIAASGKLKAVIGGPPCRTISALRFQGDDGPGIIRTEQEPYGCSTNSPGEQELVVKDSILWFRMLALFVLAEEVRPEDAQATGFLIEQPEDPKDYRSPQDIEEHQYMSMWRTQEWAAFSQRYGIHMVSFDQGTMGHIKRKPTSLGTNFEDLLALHGMRGGPSTMSPMATAERLRQAQPLHVRCQESKAWAEWSPGLKRAICLVLTRWINSHGKPGETKIQKISPWSMEQWKKHFEADHMPSRRDCRFCVQSQARSKAHRRIQHPQSYTLSVDLSGKLTPGDDQCPTGKKKGRYIMVGVYTFPTTKKGQSLLPIPGEQPPQDQPLPPEDADLEGDGADPGGDSDLLDTSMGEIPQDLPETDHHDDLDFMVEEEEPDFELPPAVEEAGKTAMDAWSKMVEENMDIGVRNVTLVEILESRSAHHVLPALARMYSKLRLLGLPLFRLHSDRARELLSAPIRRWTLDRDILTTLTTGSSFKTNGRAESEVNCIKKAARTLVAANKCPLEKWPLGVRHIAERRLRSQLRAVGWPTGDLLPFGSKAYAYKKTWQSRYEDWRETRELVKVWGPDVSSSLTNTAYYVQSIDTGKFFYTDDVITVDPQSMMEPDQDPETLPVLPVRGDHPPHVAGEIPTRRVRGKQALPPRAMQRIAGEDRLLRMILHKDKHNQTTTNHGDPSEDSQRSWSSDSWTLGTKESEGEESMNGLWEVESVGGGDMEGASNRRCGDSSPSALTTTPQTPTWFLQVQQENLHHYIQDEMEKIDGTNAEQGWCMPMLNEAILKKAHIEEQLMEEVRENPTGDVETSSDFLVTRTVSNKEVWSNIDDWKESVIKEYNQLVVNKQAVRQVTKDQLNQMAEEQGLPIELLPAKTVHVRKSGSGDYKTRAVVCGNFATPDNTDHYAGGCDAVQVRALTRCAAIKGWTMGSTDIRVAFLNAPKRDRSKVTAMEIPSIMKHLGLAGPSDVWIIDNAVYGLNTSPKDWGIHRDETLPTIKWNREHDGQRFSGTFERTEDDNLWRIVETDEENNQVWRGLMSVYVDDLLLAGDLPVVKAAWNALSKVWALSDMDWAEVDQPLKYCGFEICRDKDQDGYHVRQHMYQRDMLEKWGVNKSAAFPEFRVAEEDGHYEGVIDGNDVRRAQAMAGSLLWLSTRSRPELSFGVATMCRLSTRNPKRSLEIGQALMEFVHGNPGGLHYAQGVANGTWGARQHLKMARSVHSLEIYADIAYAAGSKHRSVQGFVAYHGGAPIAWQCNQQPFATHSTAESELVAQCEALMIGKSLEALLSTIWKHDRQGEGFTNVLYCDNQAAISLAYGNGNASWRTRHLRIRSTVLREALQDDYQGPGHKWTLLHMKGTELVADGMTKPLQGQAFAKFMQDLGVDQIQPDTKMKTMMTGGTENTTAKMALLVGSTLIASAKGENEPETNPKDMDLIWVCGLCLMVAGAAWVTQLGVQSVRCCLRRMWRASESICDDDGKATPRRRGTLSTSSMAAASSMSTETDRSERSEHHEPETESEKTEATVKKTTTVTTTTTTTTKSGMTKAKPSPPIQNPWNRFQHENRNRGWTQQQMSKEYQTWKKTQGKFK
eukprot:Skav217824  [mRNA]  locus=scaffold889:271892:280114:- [translate_table: standard]